MRARMSARGDKKTFSVRSAWYDLWIGAYVDREKRTVLHLPIANAVAHCSPSVQRRGDRAIAILCE